MTNEELKTALISEKPVKCFGIVFKCVSAIIYRKSNNGIRVSAELLDKTGNSVCIVNPTRITLWDSEEQPKQAKKKLRKNKVTLRKMQFIKQRPKIRRFNRCHFQSQHISLRKYFKKIH